MTPAFASPAGSRGQETSRGRDEAGAETKEQQMPAPEHGTGPSIVAGVDGSPSSLSALRWAVRQAALTGAAVNAVIAWHNPASQGGYGWGTAGAEQIYDFQEVAAKTLTEAVSSIPGPASEVHVRAQVTRGHPAQVLLDACEGADLLVVGSRGHGGFTEALLGSVSQHCVQHASCPVVVIRGQDHNHA
jgi:nucleotide-binding universal stress UspA family protein